MKKSGFYIWRFKDQDDRVYSFPKEEMNFEKSSRLNEEDVIEVKPLYEAENKDSKTTETGERE